MPHCVNHVQVINLTVKDGGMMIVLIIIHDWLMVMYTVYNDIGKIRKTMLVFHLKVTTDFKYD